MNELINQLIPFSGLMFFVLVALNAIDVLSTLDILLLGGYELNPVARYFMGLSAEKPAFGLCLLKALTLLGVYVLMCQMTPQEVVVMLIVSCAFYVGVVAWNLKVIADLEIKL
jgi:Domain of unknown function (DUF5658)